MMPKLVEITGRVAGMWVMIAGSLATRRVAVTVLVDVARLMLVDGRGAFRRYDCPGRTHL